mmetsp:Transcript_36466/g.91412  ORF Transcript_36466/g.91412 Transcript_36466/m.91412 type:complete len:470 (-) Transcript_36466:67-1476(-)
MSGAATEFFASAASMVAPMVQAYVHHTKELEEALRLHKEQIQQAAKQHIEALRHAELLHKEQIHLGKLLYKAEKEYARQMHLQSLRQELMHHLQQIHLDTETARRENVRDVWAQKSRKADTLMITITLMIAAFFALLVEGTLPNDTPLAFITLFSVFISLSFLLLFGSLWCTLLLSSRLAKYNIYKKFQVYNCGKIHRDYESYYTCHCSTIALAAQLGFYVGTLCLFVSATVFGYGRFFYLYVNLPAAFIYLILAGVTLAALIASYFLIPTETRQGEARPDKDFAFMSDFQNRLLRELNAYDPAVVEPRGSMTDRADEVGAGAEAPKAAGWGKGGVFNTIGSHPLSALEGDLMAAFNNTGPGANVPTVVVTEAAHGTAVPQASPRPQAPFRASHDATYFDCLSNLEMELDRSGEHSHADFTDFPDSEESDIEAVFSPERRRSSATRIASPRLRFGRLKLPRLARRFRKH